jgi:hypothetical protein
MLSTGAMSDFALLRAADELVVSVSTFSWLAAWLSRATTIHLPLSGFLNPQQNRTIDLLPIHDPRYRFYLFPVHYAAIGEDLRRSHAVIESLWREIDAAALEPIVARAAGFQCDRAVMQLFDQSFYLSRYPDVASAISVGHYDHALSHYLFEGAYEGRQPFDLDKAWYATEYPDAAVAVAQGEFADLFSYHARIGRERGHRTRPESTKPPVKNAKAGSARAGDRSVAGAAYAVGSRLADEVARFSPGGE